MDDLNDWSLGWDGMVLAYWKASRLVTGGTEQL